MLFERSSSPAPELNSRQRWAVICMDLAMLAEVTLSVYLASRQSDDFTTAFMKVFFSMFIPTIVLGIFAIRRFRDRTPETGAAA